LTYVDYWELRRMSSLTLLRRLRQLGSPTLILALEDEASRAMMPLMKGLAVATGASAIKIAGPDLQIEDVSRWNVCRSLIRMAGASAIAARDMAVCGAELKRLLQRRRPTVRTIRDRKVLYIKGNLLLGFQAGGSIGHVAGVINALSEADLEVTVASTEALGMVRSSMRQLLLNVPGIFGLPFEKSYYSVHRMMVKQLARAGTTVRPGFIYQRMAPANYAGVALSHRWNVPLVLEYNGSEVWMARNWGRRPRYPDLASATEEVCLRHAHLIVTVSEVLADELVARGVPRDRVVWYPNCVDPGVFDPAKFAAADSRKLREDLNIPANAVVVMFIGTFGLWHGVEVFAQAIRELVERQREWLETSCVRFVLVGDGPNMPVVRRLLAAAPYASFAILAGLVPQADAARYLAMADVVVSPHVKNKDGSRFFGSPTKLFEYMAMGKAIVASDLEQIGTILKSGLHSGELPSGEPEADDRRLAVLCEPGNVQALQDALRFIVDRPAWRAVLGANARAEVLARYTWGHHVSAILDGLARLPGSGRHE
jgi:glycosyltransferase involved in cell wall biosynthesis